jgi:hypothetical protein
LRPLTSGMWNSLEVKILQYVPGIVAFIALVSCIN